MEFLGTFGCIWSLKDVKQVIIGRAEHGSEVPQRRHESDLPKATHRGRSHLTPLSERPPKATPRGRSRLYGETTRSEARSDLSERPTEVAPEGRSDLSERHAEVEGLEGQEKLCFINNNGSWYKKEPNFQYNNYQQKSYSNNQQSGYPPRNNQQGSYQPQQNPSSGSSAPQESSTDTLLKQILESQTRSEKHVGYELKNLHTKIDGSYNELNNKFSHLASTVLECHMEFLGTFGCIWSLKDVKQVIIGRAEHGSEVPQRHHEPRATCPKRRTEVARISHPSRSDLPKRHPEVARVSMARRQEAKPGVTSQSDPLRSLPKAGATCRSDMPRSLRVYYWSNHNASSELATQLLILRHFSPERLSEYLHSQCFDIPQNWFDNLLYYNICLRSLENS
ncbi:hypothetical protein IGI04_036872 [Brassica rapa subsp. trilocularis]|uniref:Uncharacterized protein n=1 Tax=Brassica rapa subsp. trilocularis TaxID=1813537 RepID=A0ABQ7LFR6_BRACM|nr:hypothetical protein IGI04_036872 [Brassica rapa subsp. trilocularis]